MVIDDGDVTNVNAVVVEETMKGFGVVEGLYLCFVQTLTKLAPHGVEHHFGQRA